MKTERAQRGVALLSKVVAARMVVFFLGPVLLGRAAQIATCVLGKGLRDDTRESRGKLAPLRAGSEVAAPWGLHVSWSTRLGTEALVATRLRC